MNSLFKKHQVIFVHCLTKNGGAGNKFSVGKNLYERIDLVINNKLHLSCSTIGKGDTLDGQSNFFGPVGIILKNAVITYANPEDGGTGVRDDGGRDFATDQSTLATKEDIENAIINRPTRLYNELCTIQYDVVGFFLCLDSIDYLYFNIDSEEVFYENTQKYKLPYFNLSHGVLHKAIFNPLAKVFYGDEICEPDEIY